MDTPSLSQRLRRTLWYLAAGTVILAAVLLTLMRVLLPSLEGQRERVEVAASVLLGQPVGIRTMGGRLSGLSPQAVLEDVSLLDVSGQYPVARFREVRIGIDTLASLRQRHLVMSELIVVGAEIVVLRQRDGSIHVQGLGLGAPTTDSAPEQAEGIGRWLLSQGRLVLQDSRLYWEDVAAEHRLRFDEVDVELRNRGERHQLNLGAALPAGIGRRFKLALDLEGDLLQADGWRGQGYVEGLGLRPAQWLAGVQLPVPVALEGGSFDLHLWGQWEAGRFTRVSGDVAAHEIKLRGQDETRFEATRLAGALNWVAQEGGWSLALGGLRLERGAARAPLELRLEHTPRHWRVQASALSLEDVAALAVLWPDLAKEQRQQLQDLAPRGQVHQLLVEWPEDGALHAQGVLEQVGFSAVGDWPGLDGISGDLRWHGAGGQVLLFCRQSQLELPQLFRAPLDFEHLQGSLEVAHREDGWQIEARGIRAANADIEAVVEARTWLPAEGAPQLDLRGRFWNGQAANASRYFPARIMDADALAWLDRAFRAGTVTQGGVVFHGPLDAFPFDGGEGHFAVKFHALDADLHLREGWPGLSGVEAEVEFVNRGMNILAGAGRMYGSRIREARVSIADLNEAVLQVQGEALLAEGDALRLLRETPLAEDLAAYTEGLELEGRSRLNLQFRLPLSSTAARRSPLSVAGTLELKDNRLWLYRQAAVEAVSGRLHFTEHSLGSDGLQGELLDGPVSVHVATEGRGSAARTILEASGEFRMAAVQALLPLPWLANLSGGAPWQGRLEVAHGKAGGSLLALTSGLEGVKVALPLPLAKGAVEMVPLRIERHFGGARHGEMTLRYGTRASAALAFAADGRLRRGTVRFDAEPARLPQDYQLIVRGSLSEVDLALLAGGTPDTPGAAGQTWPPIVVDMEALHLAAGDTVPETAETAETAVPLAMEDVPPMEVRVARFGYGGMALGRLGFRVTRNADLLRVEDFTLQGTALDLGGEARWHVAPRVYSSAQLVLRSDDVGQLAQHLGISSVLTRGAAEVTAEVQWPGTLFDLEPAQVGGRLHVQVKDGLIEEVDPGAGRLLGLLSLQALPRRLLLDFSDLFGKGLAFRRIEGDILLGGGEAHTDNLHMETAPATVRISGRTGLATRDYDHVVTVVPNISGTAPVVGALAWGPQVGAVLLMFQKLLQQNVDEAARIQYRVTGPWDAPTVELQQPAG